MIPWRTLAQASVPGESEPLVLEQRGEEFAIRVGPHLLMSSRAHGSEELLAELALERLAHRASPRVLIGGLGMGYTLAAALRLLPPSGAVDVAELIPAVIEWNRGPLRHLAGDPLADPRVRVLPGDVAAHVRAARDHYDAILLDVDNGPNGLTRATNDALYTDAGLAAAHHALREGGVQCVWSVAIDDAFTHRLRRAGFQAEVHRARARRSRGGQHVVWIAKR
jgi:spermidine synthase